MSDSTVKANHADISVSSRGVRFGWSHVLSGALLLAAAFTGARFIPPSLLGTEPKAATTPARPSEGQAYYVIDIEAREAQKQVAAALEKLAAEVSKQSIALAGLPDLVVAVKEIRREVSDLQLFRARLEGRNEREMTK